MARAPHSRFGRAGATPPRFHPPGGGAATRPGGDGLLRGALFTAALPLCWLTPQASVTLGAALLTAGVLSVLATELAGQLRVPKGAAVALAVFAAAFGAALRAAAGPIGLLGGTG